MDQAWWATVHRVAKSQIQQSVRAHAHTHTHTHTHTAKNYNSRSATMVSHLQVLHRNGENDSFIEGVKKAERAIGSQRVAFHWLNCD